MIRHLTRPTIGAFLIVLCAAILGARPIIAQLEASCPALVLQALEEADSACAGLGRNTACYGYNQIAATFNQNVAPAFFSAPADRGELNLFESIRTSVLDTLRQRWGIAFLNVQAIVPDSLPGQGVIFVLMGDTTVENEVAPEAAFHPAAPVEATAEAATVLRSLPQANASARGEIAPGDRLLADGLSEDSAWVRAVKDDVVGWIERASVTSTADLNALPALSDTLRTPMQAFRFRTGIGRVACEQAPDVLVVQGPQNLNVNLTANGANIVLGSTIVLRTISDVEIPAVLPGHALAAGVVAFSPDSTRVATGDSVGMIRLWAQASGILQRDLAAHDGVVVGLSFLPDGRLLSAGADGALRWWDASAGTPARAVETGGPVSSFALSRDGGVVATGGQAGIVHLWDAATGEPAGTVSLDGGAAATSLAFSPDGRWLAVGGSDGSARLWDMNAGAVAQTWDAQAGAVRALAFDPLAQALATSGDDRETRLWNLPAGGLRLALPTGPARALAWSPNGYTLAVGGDGASVELWDAESGGRQTTLTGHQGSIDKLAFSADGFVLASGAADTTARLWRLAPRRMEVITLDGNVVVDGVPVPVGYRSTAPLGPDGLVAGPWTPATAVPVGELLSLVLLTELTDDVLNYPITLPLGGPVAVVPTPTPTPMAGQGSAPAQPQPTTAGGAAPTPAPPTPPVDCGLTATVGDDESFTGSDCDDVLTGSEGANTIMGAGGADSISGNGGDDFLEGGDGDDTLDGGDGNDTLEGDSGFGNDLLIGGAGDDSIFGGPGADTLQGGDGDDTLLGNEDDDTLDGGAGADLIDGGPGADTITLSDNDGVDTVYGGDGDDTIAADGAQQGDTINSGMGNNRFVAGPDLSGELTLQTENDDVLDFSALLQGISIHATEGSDPDNPFPYIAENENLYMLLLGVFRHIVGSEYDDVIEEDFSTPVDNLFEGRGGNDSLFAFDGNDTLLGGAGHDLLVSGDGDDLLDGGEGDDTLEDDEYEVGGSDTLYGRGGNDSLRSGMGDDLLDGGDGHDTLVGGPGSDTLDGGAGDDLLTDDEEYYPETPLLLGAQQQATNDDLLDGGDGNDTLYSDYGNDTLRGGAGDDSLQSGSGDDLLEGGDGNDTLYDYAGNNTLDGGAGHDAVEGGYGDDLLIGGAGDDTIWDGYGADTLLGGDDDDEIYLTGDENADYADGGTGNDTLYFSYLAADDTVTGGTGSNLFVFDWITGNLTVESQGDDTLDFSNYGEPVAIDTSIQDTPQEVAPNFWLTLRGMFQVVVGQQNVNAVTALAENLQPLALAAETTDAPPEPDGAAQDASGAADTGEPAPLATTIPTPTDMPGDTAEATPEPVSKAAEATPDPTPIGTPAPELTEVAAGHDTQQADANASLNNEESVDQSASLAGPQTISTTPQVAPTATDGGAASESDSAAGDPATQPEIVQTVDSLPGDAALTPVSGDDDSPEGQADSGDAGGETPIPSEGDETATVTQGAPPLPEPETTAAP